MSRGFLCFLAGLALTILSWYGPWAWPAWPAFTAIDLVFGTGSWYQDLSNAARSVVIVLLITLNISFWAAIAFLLGRLVLRIRGRLRPVRSSSEARPGPVRLPRAVP